MTIESLLEWWNVIYLLPFGLALLYLFAYSASGWTFGDVEAGVDADADVDMDAGVDVDADVDTDLAAEADIDGTADADQAVHHDGQHAGPSGKGIDAAGERGLLTVVWWLGVGRVPLSILLMVLFLTFGSIGFVTNQLAREWMSEHLVWLVSLPVAFVGSFAVTSVIAQALARWLPMTETSARHRRELVGLRATTIFTIDENYGVAMVRDDGGDRYQVACRVLPGGEPIAGGTEVVLVKYSGELGVFYVVPSGMADSPRLPGQTLGDMA